MTTRKATVSAKVTTAARGASLSAKYRARANELTDAQRQIHRARAMSIIYGNTNGNAVHARSR